MDFAGLDSMGDVGLIWEFSGLNIMFVSLIPGDQTLGILSFQEGRICFGSFLHLRSLAMMCLAFRVSHILLHRVPCTDIQ